MSDRKDLMKLTGHDGDIACPVLKALSKVADNKAVPRLDICKKHVQLKQTKTCMIY